MKMRTPDRGVQIRMLLLGISAKISLPSGSQSGPSVQWKPLAICMACRLAGTIRSSPGSRRSTVTGMAVFSGAAWGPSFPLEDADAGPDAQLAARATEHSTRSAFLKTNGRECMTGRFLLRVVVR
jgi:hypothetical protein